MADLETHCQDCFLALGESFQEVHEWLDEFFSKDGPDHRVHRHHVEGIEEVRRKWGDRAAQAAEIHVKRDFGSIPTQEDMNLWATLWS